MASLSTANSIVYIDVPGVIFSKMKLEGFGADDAFAFSDVENAETVMGVDGKLSAGFTPYPVSFDITIQADSTASNVFFDNWIQQEQAARDKYTASMTVYLQGNGSLYTFTKGYLKKFQPGNSAKKILQQRTFTIEFESVTKGPI